MYSIPYGIRWRDSTIRRRNIRVAAFSLLMLLFSFIRISSYASASTCVTEYGSFLCKTNQNLHNRTTLIKWTTTNKFTKNTRCNSYPVSQNRNSEYNCHEHILTCKIWGSHSRVAKNLYRLGCYARSTRKQVGQLLISQLCVCIPGDFNIHILTYLRSSLAFKCQLQIILAKAPTRHL